MRSEAAARTGSVRSPAADPARASWGPSTTTFALGLMLLLGLLVRLLFINADGFKNDVSTFESWSLTLAEHPLREFFAKAGFADYPPGYFFVLWFVGHAYKLLVPTDPTYGWLKVFVKLPGILMDLVDTALIFVIVRRFASVAWAFAAAAAFAFNPATIFISAYWGQVDSVAAGLTLGSLLLLLDADRRTGRAQALSVVGAWLLLAYSILIKPPAVVLVPLYLAYVFTTDDAALRLRRAVATALGVVASFALAYLAALAFNPTYNPLTQFGWLLGRYAYASGVYPYNSVNAFNLYVMAVNHFWQPDSNLIPNWNVAGHAVGLPLYDWGIGLFGAATLLVVSRFVQRRDPVALLEAAMVLSLGYFVLSTRMHERYVFNAVLLAIPLVFFRKRYLYAAVILSLTLLGNLFYSFDYLGAVNNPVAGVDQTDLIPWLSHPAAILNVATFFYLGYVYLGAGSDALEGVDLGAWLAGAGARARRWFRPLEGTVAMTPRDWILASSLSVASFVLTFVDYTWPREKIFDEIYYARAGEEYLTHKEIFEFTHPPLTKLWITLSMILFGGMHGGGDTSAGWRFLNLVMGALMVFALYCFAKRLLGSTFFATVAAGLLLFDGFHYVQSRIATPEITVAFFSLLTIYAFYRFWIASQVRVAPAFSARAWPTYAIATAAVLALAGIFAALVARGQGTAAYVVAFLYAACGTYVAMRAVVPRMLKAKAVVSYAEGSRVLGGTLETLDGGRIPAQGAGILAGQSTRVEKNALVHLDDGLRIAYARGGAVAYETDDGAAGFTPDGTMQAGTATIDGNRDGRLWLWLLAGFAACLAASKWNGLFDFFVVWGLAFAVVAQRYWSTLLRAVGRAGVLARPASWGNPFGFSLDLLVAAMLFVGGTVYVLCYIPYFRLGHTLGDLVGLQQQMFGYHYDLKATHPYGSKWWQWPFILRPISYFYHDWRTGAATQDPTACCVAEIIAIPNPAVWWLGLVSIPFAAWLAFRERHKGCALLVTAYLLQWLPWASSPRVSFEYHFFPNLAVICLANAILLQRLWNYGAARVANVARLGQFAVGGYLALVVGLFVFFFPILAGLHVRWDVWDARMWHWLMHNQWV